MPAEMKAKWLEALRSGKYKQGMGNLEIKNKDSGSSYCCLGALQKEVQGYCADMPAPALEWYKANRIQIGSYGDAFDEVEVTLMGMNDGLDTLKNNTFGLEERKYTFPEIADFIEEHVGVTGE